MIKFNRKICHVLNYKIIFVKYNFFIFFRSRLLQNTFVNKIKNFCKINNIRTTYMTSNFFPLGLNFLRGTFLVLYGNNLDILLRIFTLHKNLLDFKVLFLFFKNFLPFFTYNELEFLLIQYKNNIFFIFCHICLKFIFFYLKIFFWINKYSYDLR